MEQAKVNNLANRIAEGDVAAEKQLYNYFKDEVEFLIRLKIGKNSPDWEDLRQEIFIAFFQRIKKNQYDSTKGTLGAFIRRVLSIKEDMNTMI